MIRVIYQILGVCLLIVGVGVYTLNPTEVSGLTSPIFSINLSMLLSLAGLALLFFFSPVRAKHLSRMVQAVKDAIKNKNH